MAEKQAHYDRNYHSRMKPSSFFHIRPAEVIQIKKQTDKNSGNEA